jgi:hypothetical protein
MDDGKITIKCARKIKKSKLKKAKKKHLLYIRKNQTRKKRKDSQKKKKKQRFLLYIIKKRKNNIFSYFQQMFFFFFFNTCGYLARKRLSTPTRPKTVYRLRDNQLLLINSQTVQNWLSTPQISLLQKSVTTPGWPVSEKQGWKVTVIGHFIQKDCFRYDGSAAATGMCTD